MRDTATLFRNLADALEAGERNFLHDLSEALQTLAKKTGDAACARAARAMNQQSPGRPAMNDTKAIEEALDLFEQGEARSLSQALYRVARRLNPYGDRKSWRSIAERLRRKYAKTKKVSTK
ncbi:hypothetical protein DC522_01340 [Microvirga sp. KLBC 81]|uniref:hypothetical protein n=1 Tax=Microvirga sp. KLBC 81 TaxID=1862707 RepID=UPI000D51D939|nr:hypothetical protein [Microvirga sp. KLBC 81]PVE26435.1 hypothetical protein DC522_01340 [Microvirga sp. KLBC 81]